MSEIWYKVVRGTAKIEAVSVVRSTEHKVVLAADGYYSKERLCNQVSSYDSYYPTWDEAHAKLLADSELALNYARVALQRAQGHHGNVAGLTPPSVRGVLPTGVKHGP